MGVFVRLPVTLELSLEKQGFKPQGSPWCVIFPLQGHWLGKFIHKMLVVFMCWKDSSCWAPLYPGNVWFNPSLPVDESRRIWRRTGPGHQPSYSRAGNEQKDVTKMSVLKFRQLCGSSSTLQQTGQRTVEWQAHGAAGSVLETENISAGRG